VKKDTGIFLKHILESIEWIQEFTFELDRKGFLDSVQVQDAVIRRLEILGEAAKNTPAQFRKNHSAIAWNKMTGMRDKLIHGYFGVDLDLVWKVVERDLPQLKEQIQKLLKEEQAGNQTTKKPNGKT